MKWLKKTIRRSSLYPIFKNAIIERNMRRWTEQDRKMVDFYRQFINPGNLCFDIGANMGNRTRIFLKLGARVVAVEPQKQCMTFLLKHFGNDQRVVLVQKALGERTKQAEMMVSDENTLSSLSHEWIKKVTESGRFGDSAWRKKQRVQMTTLDNLIRQNGIPSFMKIDVEGYEYQVVKGLTAFSGTLSLEFTPEVLDVIHRCIEHLSRLGKIQLNYAVGETMALALSSWITPEEMIDILSKHRNAELFGDVYVRFCA